MRGKAHSPDVRAAVLAALLSGRSPVEVSREHNLDRTLVWRWYAEELQQIATEKKAAILRGVLDTMDETFQTLVAQHKVFRDPKWLQKQTAANLAVLHGVLADKGFRLLSTFARLEGTGGEDGQPAAIEP